MPINLHLSLSLNLKFKFFYEMFNPFCLLKLNMIIQKYPDKEHKIMNPRTFAFWLSMLLFFSISLRVPCHAVSFSADMMDKKGEQTSKHPFQYQDKSYRFGVTENGRELIVMVDAAAQMTRILFPAEKLYYELKSDDIRGAVNNPFRVFSYLAEKNTVRTEAAELVSGLACKKQIVSMNGQDFLSAWVSQEFDFPIRIESPMDGSTVELQNIKREPQEPGFVSIPFGYTQAVEKTEPQPEWVSKVSDSPLLMPPFEKGLDEGGILRMLPKKGAQIRIEGSTPADKTTTFTSVPFKAGKPLYNPMENTSTLEDEGLVTVTLQESPEEADEIVVYVSRGHIDLKVSFEPNQKEKPVSAQPLVNETENGAEILEIPLSISVASLFEVTWKGPASKEDFISVARPDQTPGAFVTKTSVREGNPLRIWAPSDPGEYEVRYILGRGAKLLARAPLTITPALASVETRPSANVADWIEVSWNGPLAPGDFISVATPAQRPGAYVNQARINKENPIKLRAPSDPGEYEVRYILGRGAKLLAKAPITINPVRAKVEAPLSAPCKTIFEVRWQGPGYGEDFISVARINQPPGAYLAFTSVRKGNPLTIKAPLEAGDYEVRYVLGRGNRLLAKVPIRIEAPAV